MSAHSATSIDRYERESEICPVYCGITVPLLAAANTKHLISNNRIRTYGGILVSAEDLCSGQPLARDVSWEAHVSHHSSERFWGSQILQPSVARLNLPALGGPPAELCVTLLLSSSRSRTIAADAHASTRLFLGSREGTSRTHPDFCDNRGPGL